MSKVMIEFDARQDAAEKALKKLQGQMEKMTKAPKAMNREMGVFTKSTQGLVAHFGGLLTVGAAVSTMIQGWRTNLDRSIASAKNLGDTLRGVLAGAGLGQHTAAMREYMQRPGMLGTMMQEDALGVMRSYIGARPTASLQELQAMTQRAAGLHAEFGGDTAAVSAIAKMSGEFVAAGVEQNLAMQTAYTVGTQSEAPAQVMQAFRRRAGDVGATAAMQELPTFFSMAAAGQRGTAVQQLHQAHESMGYMQAGMSFQEFVQTVPEGAIPLAARAALRTVREGIPAMGARIEAGAAAYGMLGDPYGDEVTELQQQAARTRSRTQARRDPVTGARDNLALAEIEELQEGTPVSGIDSRFVLMLQRMWQALGKDPLVDPLRNAPSLRVHLNNPMNTVGPNTGAR